jgi:hypothetical protein
MTLLGLRFESADGRARLGFAIERSQSDSGLLRLIRARRPVPAPQRCREFQD